MKTKPYITNLLLILLSISFLLNYGCKSQKQNDNKEIIAFLTSFGQTLKSGDDKALLNFFDEKIENPKVLKKLLDIISGKTNFLGTDKPLFPITLDFEGADLIVSEKTEASVPAYFQTPEPGERRATLTFKMRKNPEGKLKFYQIDAQDFLAQYIICENLIKTKNVSEKDIFDPKTLEAFKKAGMLKSRYDTVVWFAHLNSETYYYVANGEWISPKQFGDLDITKNNLGLLNPDLKEIIPPKYNLIHNISGTIEGLIEVEKDKKRGMYNLNGQLIVPVDYDQIFPVTNDSSLAILQKGKDFFRLRNNYSISNKIETNITDVINLVPSFSAVNMTGTGNNNILEINSRDDHASVYVSPSYLADLKIFNPVIYFKNPLRKNVQYYDMSTRYVVSASESVKDNETGFLEATLYSIRDYFLGGRSEFYDRKNIVIKDNQNAVVYTGGITNSYEEYSDGPTYCKDFKIKAIGDNQVEIKSSATTEISATGTSKEYLIEAPVYHYLNLNNKKIEPDEKDRVFAFTSYVKMDDSYLRGCYSYATYKEDSNKADSLNTDYLKPEYLQYVINEIYASHNFKFKDTLLNEQFSFSLPNYKA